VRSSRVTAAIAGCLAGLLLAGCMAGPSSRPEVVVNDGGGEQPAPTSTSVEVPPLGEANPTINWSNCADEEEFADRLGQLNLPTWLPVKCGRVTSVLDSPYAPGRGVARLRVLSAGSGPVPVVVVNDIDGMPGTLYAARLAAGLPQDLLSKITLIGMDRRGTGNSGGINCIPTDTRLAVVDVDPTDLDVEHWLEPAQKAGQQCALELEAQLPALDTWRTSADLDRLREELGMRQLHAIGHGEGSRVLSVYAERFPGQVGRMVLDGAPDPTKDASISLEGVAKGAQATLTAFAADCVATGCPLGAEPEVAVSQLFGQLRENPLSGPSMDLTAGVALTAVRLGLADRASWPSLAAAIAAASTGDPTGLLALVEPVVLPSQYQGATLDGTLVTVCNDTTTRLAPERITKFAKDWQEKYPVFGAYAAQQLTQCSPWTVPDKSLPSPTARDAPPIVVIGTGSDPVTPHDGSERAAQQLRSGVFVSWQGAGHGALPGSPCAVEATVAFLIDGKPPRGGLVCPP